MDYSMIIVDDEKIIREGMKTFIEKKNCGFAVKEIFEDGREAMEWMRDNPVDLVLTDIRMADVNGLEVAEFAQKHCSDTEVVILSGYKDFEYAQKAIAYGVTKYLLKPVKNAEILTTLGEVRERLDAARMRSRQQFYYDEFLRQRREQFFVDLMFGGIEETDTQMWQTLCFEQQPENIHAAMLTIRWPEEFLKEVWKYGKERAQTPILNFFASCENHVFSMVIEDDCFLILSAEDTIKQDVDGLKAWARDTFQAELYIRFLYSCQGMDRLRLYKRLDTQDGSRMEQERGKLLCSYLSTGMYGEARKLFLELLSQADNPLLEGERLIQLICENVFKFDTKTDWTIFCERLRKGEEPGRVFQSLCDYFGNNARGEHALITGIKDYVKENYQKDISLELVADKVYLHPVYMSRFFKQQTGENFRDYLLRVRMTNAIALLKCNRYKIYEIAQMVGYKSSKYFSQQFKRYTGCTPKAYCRNTWNINYHDA